MGDNVNHPSHYAEGRRYEPIDVIEDWELDFHLGNAVKYISRAGRKGDAREDIEKAVWYLNRWLERQGGASEDVPTPVSDDLDPFSGSVPHTVSVPHTEKADPIAIETPLGPVSTTDTEGTIRPWEEPRGDITALGLRDIS